MWARKSPSPKSHAYLAITSPPPLCMPRTTPLSQLLQPVHLRPDRIIIPPNRNHHRIPAFLNLLLPLHPLIPIPKHNLPPPTSHLLKSNDLGVQTDHPKTGKGERKIGYTRTSQWAWGMVGHGQRREGGIVRRRGIRGGRFPLSLYTRVKAIVALNFSVRQSTWTNVIRE